MSKAGPPINPATLRAQKQMQAKMVAMGWAFLKRKEDLKRAQQEAIARRLAAAKPPPPDPDPIPVRGGRARDLFANARAINARRAAVNASTVKHTEPKVRQLRPPSPPAVLTKSDGTRILSFATTGLLGRDAVFCAPMTPGAFSDDLQLVFVAPISVETSSGDVLGFVAQANLMQAGEPMFVAKANVEIPGKTRLLRAQEPSQHFFEAEPGVVLGRKGQWQALWFPRKPTNVMSFDTTGWPLFVAFAEHVASNGTPAYVSEMNTTSQDGEPLFIGPQIYLGREGIETLFCARSNKVEKDGNQLFIHYANFHLNGRPACVLPFNFSRLAGANKMPTKADPLALKRSSTSAEHGKPRRYKAKRPELSGR
jgi:hypothetical protein